MNNSIKFIPIYGGDKIQTPRFIIPHFHPVKVAWDWLILLLILYTAISEPFAVCFYAQYTGNKLPQGVFDTLVDVLFIVDIILTFFTTVHDSKGDLVVSKREIRRAYLKVWFPIDVVAAVPYSAIGMVTNHVGLSDAAVRLI